MPRAAASPSPTAASVVASLRALASPRVKRDMKERYGITGPTADGAFGVGMSAMQKVAKGVKSKDAAANHALAAALWATGNYEARMVACMVDDAPRVTRAQMDAWCRDFDNWGIVDTVCFKLFDQVEPTLAFAKIAAWAKLKGEFQRRAGFVLMACVALHSDEATDAQFIKVLPLVEKHAADGRNFVTKGINWALRSVGGRSPGLRKAAAEVSRRLAGSEIASARWIGNDALRKLARR